MPRQVTFEHIEFRGLGRDEAVVLERDLEAMEGAARLFAAGLYDIDIDISWSLSRSRSSHWLRDRQGRLGAHVWVDLESPLNRPTTAFGRQLSPEEYKAAFRAGFLHGLGRLTASPGPDLETPLDRAARTARVGRRVRDWIDTAAGQQVLAFTWERLESARSDVQLMRKFRGAARHLAARLEWDRLIAEQSTGVDQLVSALALAMREQGGSLGSGPEQGEIQDEAVQSWAPALEPQVSAALRALLPYLRSLWQEESVSGGYKLAEVLLTRIAPVLMEMPVGVHEVTPPAPDESEEAPDRESVNLRSISPHSEVRTRGAAEAIGTRVVFLPHTQGGEVMVRIDVAQAATLAPDKLDRLMLDGMVNGYGTHAREAFAQEAGSLRRALRVNWERRRRGRYRSGKHVGIANLRRYLLLEDPRLFQRLEHPNEMSYYFHLLVDTSYSMLEADSGAKALAVAYAFTELLTSLRVPVDVTLYASGVTQLFDHRIDRLDPYFGGDFGFLISGTMEMEAIAYAKMKADRLDRDRKVLIVITDGTPVRTTLPFVGAPGLGEYFSSTLVPWLKQSDIDLLALGIGVDPSYHMNSVTLTDSWESIGVFTALLEGLVAEGDRRASEFWT